MAQTFTVLSWVVAVALALTVPILVLAYRRVLRTKRAEISKFFIKEAKEKYIVAFNPGAQNSESEAPNDSQQRDGALDQLFNTEYHWSAYIAPILFVFSVTLGSSIVSLTALGFQLGLPVEAEQLIDNLPDAVIAGLAGAYVWVIYDFLRRFASSDLTPMVIYFGTVRIIAAGIVGFLITALVNESFAVPTAFGLGAFPTGTLQSILKEQVSSRLELRNGGTRGEAPTLQNIQGITPNVAERLLEEGIDSAEALAYTDPLKLLLRTNLQFKVILDLIDQAFLYIYVGASIQKLREVGIRPATDLTDIGILLLSEDTSDQELGQAVLQPIATALNMEHVGIVQNLIAALQYDPQVALIIKMWGETNALASDEVSTVRDVVTAQADIDKERAEARPEAIPA